MKTQAYALAIAAALTLLLAACGGDEGPQVQDTDEAFLQEVREGAMAAKSSESGNVAAGSKFSKIELETNLYEMGVIANDKLAHAQIKVHNRGTADLKITDVKTSCGCTIGKMVNPIIAPGESGTLEITVDPSRIPLFYAKKTLTLFTNDPLNPNPRVDVETHVQPEYELIPENFNFAELRQGNAGESTIRLRQLQEAPLEITALTLRQNSPHLTAKYESVPEDKWKVPGKREYDLKVAIAPTAPQGNYTGAVQLTTNVKRQSHGATLRFDAKVVGVYKIEPGKVALRNLNHGQDYKSVLSIRSEEAVEILELTNLNKNVTVTHRPGDKPGLQLFDLLIAEAPDARLQRDRWTMRIKAHGKEYTETVEVSLIMAPQE